MSSNYDQSSSTGLHSLATIIKRLEAATSRLEDVYLASAGASSVQRDLAASIPPEQKIDAPKAAVPDDPKSVTVYDEVIVQSKLQPYLKLSDEIGGIVNDQALLVKQLFADQRTVILRASASQKPSDADLPTILKPLIDGLGAIAKIKDDNRAGKNRDFFNHLSAVADGSPAVGWVAVTPKPGPVVSEAKDAAQFYANRVIKDYKEKDPKHVEWIKSFTALLEELRKYVMEYHTTGLTWNPKGGNALSWTPGAAAASSFGPVAGGPPPPPPPPPAPALNVPASAAPAPAAATGGIGAVFADLNKGESVTSGLRKVSKEEMTHKNPSLRVSGTVPERPKSPGPPAKKPMKPSKPTALAGKKPSKMALEGNKWIIEFYENDRTLVVDNTERDQSVNLYGCKNVVVQVKGKVNAVTMSNCSKSSILVESVISSIAIANSPSFALQITGTAPTIQLDATDSGQIYLSKDALGVEIMTAKCSSINVSLPVEGEEEGVFEEKAIPEMLRTVVKDGKLVTNFVEHNG